MTIRLTSIEAFDMVLEKLKQDRRYNEETNLAFTKYCIPFIKEGLAKGDDEWYLDVDWMVDQYDGKVEMVIRYYMRSAIQTDEEYLTEKEEEK